MRWPAEAHCGGPRRGPAAERDRQSPEEGQAEDHPEEDAHAGPPPLSLRRRSVGGGVACRLEIPCGALVARVRRARRGSARPCCRPAGARRGRRASDVAALGAGHRPACCRRGRRRSRPAPRRRFDSSSAPGAARRRPRVGIGGRRPPPPGAVGVYWSTAGICAGAAAGRANASSAAHASRACEVRCRPVRVMNKLPSRESLCRSSPGQSRRRLPKLRGNVTAPRPEVASRAPRMTQPSSTQRPSYEPPRGPVRRARTGLEARLSASTPVRRCLADPARPDRLPRDEARRLRAARLSEIGIAAWWLVGSAASPAPSRTRASPRRLDRARAARRVRRLDGDRGDLVGELGAQHHRGRAGARLPRRVRGCPAGRRRTGLRPILGGVAAGWPSSASSRCSPGCSRAGSPRTSCRGPRRRQSRLAYPVGYWNALAGADRDRAAAAALAGAPPARWPCAASRRGGVRRSC